MSRRRFVLPAFVVVLGLMAITLAGCNLYDGIDTSLSARTEEDLIAEGRLDLATGDFAAAREHFEVLRASGRRDDPVDQGYGEALAGEAGFTLLPWLNILQNGIGPYDRKELLFPGARLIKDRPLLERALATLMDVGAPARPDRITRALVRVAAATRLLLDKYDTNRNGRLDRPDYIDFDTNDAKVASWPFLYRDLVTGPSPNRATLEDAFIDLCYGFDGRGPAWTFTSPVAGRVFSGTYSDSNRATILAVADFVEALKTANTFFQVNEASFTAALRDLDGVDE